MDKMNNKGKSKTIPEREYVFASSFLKANDLKGTPAERLNKIKDSRDTSSIKNVISESFGVSGSDVYDQALTKAVENVKSVVPDFSVFLPLIYKYDCTNIKTAIKCQIKNVDPTEMMYSCGSISKDVIIQAVSSSNFTKIPGKMGEAAATAYEQYKKSGETRVIDLYLDCACFEDMKDAADKSGVELIKDIVSLKADEVNILTSLRIQNQNVVPEMFHRAFVTGGTLSESAFLLHDGSLKEISEVRPQFKGKSFEQIEKEVDTEIIKMCEKYHFKPFGAEVAVRYIVILEMELMNCRIAEAALKNSNREEILRERLREAYV